ncbi:MAG TPA: AbrB/MazE/SpoVT family DNA-binding domain-containing protein [Caulobacteraceae bacterium]|jgi:antitoxin VapB|nr:AbrB/MazE/SpoVT family DNA-binding domain-containing protein [Caulobacteraceae bacterium]
MTTASSKTFRSGNSIALRMPKDVAFPEGTEVTIVRSGDVMTIYPKKQMTLQEMLRRLDELPIPGVIEERDTDLPERPGL